MAITCESKDVLNGLTIDVEDWAQSVFDPATTLTDHFRRNTGRVLDALAARGIRATFFVLGLAGRKAPDLVRQIHAAGHEIQSHGYGHRPIHTLTARQLREDVLSSRSLLEDLVGHPVVGYRAPAFSITSRNLWALNILGDCGITLDSSIFPVQTGRYGVNGIPPFPHRLRISHGRTLLEIPVASYRFLGQPLPLGGGGYFRLFPHAMIRRTVLQSNRCGYPATVYLHPYEYNPTEIAGLPHRVPGRLRLHQTWGRQSIPAKFDRLLKEFRFGPLCEVIASLSVIPAHSYDLNGAKGGAGDGLSAVTASEESHS